MRVLRLRRRNLGWVLSPHAGIAKEEKNPMCVLSLYVGIAIEKESFNMYFANDMQKLHTLYLSNDKQNKRIGIAFWY